MRDSKKNEDHHAYRSLRLALFLLLFFSAFLNASPTDAAIGRLESALTAAEKLREAPEYQLKAAFLLNFARFTEWPETALSKWTEINLCVIGPDPFGNALEQIVGSQSIHGKPVKVVRLKQDESPKRCQILFVNTNKKEQIASLLSAAKKWQILTISDAPDFINNGGMIQFVEEEQHIRFAISLKATEAAGLKLSSKLIQLAKSVEMTHP